MSFPTTSVITSFTGGDEAPLSEGATWAGPIQSGVNQPRRVSNAVANPTSGSGQGQSAYASVNAADLEAFATVSVLPIAGDNVDVWVRIKSPNTGSAKGYYAWYTTGTGWRVYRFEAPGTFVQVGGTDATAMSAGEKIGCEVIGTTVRALHYTGGAWVQRVSGTDSAVTGAGQIGLEIYGALTSAAARLDDFGGGAVVTGPPAGSLMLLGVGS